MKLVVDSNVLFTFFWKNSVARELFLKQDLELFAPEFALQEINKYHDEIMRKAKLSPHEFNKQKHELSIYIEFISIEEYSLFFMQASEITPDRDDVDFVALSLMLSCPIWSNDIVLKNQKHFKVLTTKEVIETFD
ncbi:hypothetical protein HYU06_06500 [Candidatus Woesearchaeota archaeon]|nr:hypothetical protein [Candidatus Woesearchaeota archaeon]